MHIRLSQSSPTPVNASKSASFRPGPAGAGSFKPAAQGKSTGYTTIKGGMGPLPANGCMAIRTFARSKINPIGPWPNQNLIKQYDIRYT